jgi:positive regulator of sigma E activity
MKYLKYTPFVYLIAGLILMYDGYKKMQASEESYWLSFILAAIAVGMFFFRRHYAQKFQQRRDQERNSQG